MISPILWKRKLRLRMAKWFSQTIWVVSKKLKKTLRSQLFPLPHGSPSEKGLAFLEAVKDFSYSSPYCPFSLGMGRKYLLHLSIQLILSKSCLNQWILPPHPISIYLHPSCPGPDLEYLCAAYGILIVRRKRRNADEYAPCLHIKVIWGPQAWH